MGDPPTEERLRRRALTLLQRNRRSGHSDGMGLDYAYTMPSHSMYPTQFFWDSCFHAIVLAELGDDDFARRELRSLVSAQRRSGRIPHAIFWRRDLWPPLYWAYTQSRPTPRPRLSGMIQPPVLAYAVLRVAERTGDEAFARAMLPRVRAYHDWLRRERDPDRDGLVSVVSPYESGMDFSPPYDLTFAMRPGANDVRRWVAWRARDVRNMRDRYVSARMLARYDVEDVALNSIWYEAQMSLAALARRLGEDAAAAVEDAGARKTRASLLARAWDDRARFFFLLSGARERRVPIRTAAGLMPLLLDDLDSSYVEALVGTLDDPEAFDVPFPLPSVAVGEPSFRRQETTFLWRGPTWLNINWFVARGLRKQGCDAAARRLARATVTLVERSGFREFYDPWEGYGMGARDFSWSTLAVDLVALAGDT